MGLIDLSHVPTHNEPRGYDPEGDFFKSSKRVDDGTKPANVNFNEKHNNTLYNRYYSAQIIYSETISASNFNLT